MNGASWQVGVLKVKVETKLLWWSANEAFFMTSSQ
jgi:hypothetical protein